MATTSRGSRADITLTPDMTDGSTRVLTWLTHSPARVSCTSIKTIPAGSPLRAVPCWQTIPCRLPAASPAGSPAATFSATSFLAANSKPSPAESLQAALRPGSLLCRQSLQAVPCSQRDCSQPCRQALQAVPCSQLLFTQLRGSSPADNPFRQSSAASFVAADNPCRQSPAASFSCRQLLCSQLRCS